MYHKPRNTRRNGSNGRQKFVSRTRRVSCVQITMGPPLPSGVVIQLSGFMALYLLSQYASCDTLAISTFSKNRSLIIKITRFSEKGVPQRVCPMKKWYAQTRVSPPPKKPKIDHLSPSNSVSQKERFTFIGHTKWATAHRFNPPSNRQKMI